MESNNVNELVEKIRNQSRKLDNHLNVLNELKETVSSLPERIQNLETDIGKIDENPDGVRKLRGEVKESLNTIYHRLHFFSEQLGNQEQIKQLSLEIEALKNQVQSKKLSKEEAELKAVNNKLELIGERLNTLENDLTSKCQHLPTIDDFQEEAAIVQQLINQAKRESEGISEMLQALQGEEHFTQWHEKLMTTSKRLAFMNTAVNGIQRKQYELDSAITNIQGEVEQLKTERSSDSIDNDVRKLPAYQSLAVEQEKINERMEKLQKLLFQLKSNVESGLEKEEVDLSAISRELRILREYSQGMHEEYLGLLASHTKKSRNNQRMQWLFILGALFLAALSTAKVFSGFLRSLF